MKHPLICRYMKQNKNASIKEHSPRRILTKNTLDFLLTNFDKEPEAFDIPRYPNIIREVIIHFEWLNVINVLKICVIN